MKINVINNNIVHFIADTQYELTSTFIRFEEFYESPYSNIRGNYFTLEQYMDVYAANNDGKFTYFSDWTGFNIPGDSILQFERVFLGNLRSKELEFLSSLQSHNKKYHDNGQRYYVIGTIDTNSIDADLTDYNKMTLNHEYAHAYYYLNDSYRTQCDKIYDSIPTFIITIIRNALLTLGYDESTIKDETQAYLSTSSDAELNNKFGFNKYTFPLNRITEYRILFDRFPKMISTPL